MALKPIYAEQLPNGSLLFGLGPEDFEKVRQGYACGTCLEEFGFWQANCPLCGCPLRADGQVAPPPRHWLPSPEAEDVRGGAMTIDDTRPDSALGEAGEWLKKRRR